MTFTFYGLDICRWSMKERQCYFQVGSFVSEKISKFEFGLISCIRSISCKTQLSLEIFSLGSYCILSNDTKQLIVL